MRIELTRYRTLFRVSWVVWLAGVVWGSLVSGNEMSSLESALPLLQYDKLVHYGAYAGLALLSMLAFERRRGIVTALSMILLGAVIELLQHFSPGRTPDIADATANAFGVLSGIAVGLFLTRVWAPSRHAIPAALAAGLTLLAPMAVHAQALNACDLNGDGTVDIRDAQMAANMALALAPCTANVVGPGVCDISVIQRVIDAALSGLCRPGALHSVTLNWTASTSSNVTGYNVYRGTHSNGPYTKVNSAVVAGTAYTDLTVLAGQTYYYVTTAVDADNNESAYSNGAPAVIPSP